MIIQKAGSELNIAASFEFIEIRLHEFVIVVEGADFDVVNDLVFKDGHELILTFLAYAKIGVDKAMKCIFFDFFKAHSAYSCFWRVFGKWLLPSHEFSDLIKK